MMQLCTAVIFNNYLSALPLQLTTDTYTTAVSVFSQTVELSANDTTKQTVAALSDTTNYLSDLSVFVQTSDVIINSTVGF